MRILEVHFVMSEVRVRLHLNEIFSPRLRSRGPEQLIFQPSNIKLIRRPELAGGNLQNLPKKYVIKIIKQFQFHMHVLLFDQDDER